MIRTAVIMAGGSGERFWPLSRKNRPKQLLALTSEKMMIEEAIERIQTLIPIEHIYIFTSEILQTPIREELPALPPENVVAEPSKRNTAPCLAFAAVFLTEKYKVPTSELSMAVLTADHYISTVDQFVETVENALHYAESNNALVTIGIPPTRPETGYGYIEINNTGNDGIITSAVSFREKPTYETALSFLKSGNFLWNSGMFFWRLDTLLDSFRSNLPEIGSSLAELGDLLKTRTSLIIDGSIPEIRSLYKQFPDISIDYGIMEKAGNVAVARALFLWDDVGSWDSLDRMRPQDTSVMSIRGKMCCSIQEIRFS
ncbi:MAG: mannose-1-phosphate guanylyltransferase [Ignavibacteria bacterium]|nr:mannose-1-phosphate guanylyltransferase [Ignavibacteria bacterium]